LVTDGNSEITDDVMLMEDDFYDDEEILSAVPAQEVAASGYKLILSSENENFGQAAELFDGATSSFDKAVDSFEEAAKKIEKLQ
jgi:hypothetical protein